ncbi:hypothetical protein [Pseudomonas chlororaphis]|uniref:hypothetical protein n=1 Tax=Pseudomonas chlororaphis TaxID=587753 RepID=UPI0019D185C1|nr:hypothetical protein [Pseudomonas chlororaphis]
MTDTLSFSIPKAVIIYPLKKGISPPSKMRVVCHLVCQALSPSIKFKGRVSMSKRPVILEPACVKTLSAVEARPERSNQHEFNGVAELKKIFGPERTEFNAVFTVRGEKITDRAKVTWYDARENHETRSEYRLYFQGNDVMQHAQEGDNVVIGFDNTGVLHCILIRSGSVEHEPGIRMWQTL